MPWKASSVMEQKLRFVLEYEKDEHTMSELCQCYDIARETGYVWLRRYRQAGLAELMERSRAAHRQLVRSVRAHGHFRWKKYDVFLSEVLWGEQVGLLPEDDRWFTIYFAHLPLARFDSWKLEVTPLPKITEGFYSVGAGGKERHPLPAPHPPPQSHHQKIEE